MLPSNEIPLPVIVGPTGSGKSDLSILLANRLGGEIVNCDSVQVYRGFDIGTAKVSQQQRTLVPHHLIDIVEPTQLFTAGDFARLAEVAIRDISARGRTPIIVGGTGFYLRALLEGLSPGPQRNDALRARLEDHERRRPGSLHRILARFDPGSADRIHRNDKNKTMRALEVCLVEREPLSSVFERGRAGLIGFKPIKIGLMPARELLYAKLNERARTMFFPKNGQCSIVNELRALLASGLPMNAKPLESLGYKQAIQVIAGHMTVEAALESTQAETRHYAKRQLTWFRKEPNVHWIVGFGDETQVQHDALLFVKESHAQ